MRREIMIAKLRKQQEEILHMLEDLDKNKQTTAVLREAFKKRIEASETLVETLQDKSFIPGSQVTFNVNEEIKNIEKKIEDVLESIRKLEKLEVEKKKIQKKLSDELTEE